MPTYHKLTSSAVRVAIAVGLAATLASSTAFAEALLERSRTDGIRVGAANIAPHVILQGGTQTGEAIEVARAVLEEMDVANIEIVSIDFGSLIPALQAGRIDMIASGMSITPPRCEQVAFSDPYYGKAEALIVAKGNPLEIKDYRDIAAHPEARLGHVLGGTEGPQAADAGIPEARISTYPDSATLADALRAGRIDALALPDLQVNWILAREGWEEFETPGPFVPQLGGKDQVLYTSFGFSPQEEEFRDRFSEILDRMKKDGTVAEIVQPFGISDFGVELAVDRTWQEICSGEY